MFAAFLILPALISGVLVFFLVDKSLLIFLLPPLAVYMALVYIFKSQINSWWDKRFPPKMDDHTKELLRRYFPYYRNLKEEEKRRFEMRVELFRLEKQYFHKDLDQFPYDIKILIIANAIQVTFGHPEFLMDKWSTIVIYKSAFHSPQLQEFHTGELHFEDGVVILAVDPMLKGMLKPDLGYNMAIHQFAKAFQHDQGITNDDFIFIAGPPQEKEDEYLRKLSEIRGRAFRFEKFYGLFDGSDLFGVSVEHFFIDPEKFSRVLPESYKAIKRIINQDMLKASNPVVNILIQPNQ